MSERLKAVAADTLEILGRGWYVGVDGRRVELAPGLANATVHYPEEQLEVPRGTHRTMVSVVNASTLEAAARLDRPAVLNFASARKPGGGFINGAQAQEESIARASSLYSSLIQARPFYAFHRSHDSLLYSDHLIHSPTVQVFKDDAGRPLARPYTIAVITAAAPNTRMIAVRQAHRLAEVPDVLRERGAKILAVAAHHGHRALVLGAWGCGVFGNDPRLVADTFAGLLNGPFQNVFEQVVFAVLGDGTYRAFQEAAWPA